MRDRSQQQSLHDPRAEKHGVPKSEQALLRLLEEAWKLQFNKGWLGHCQG
jgi:hypothetical protein